MTIQQDAIELLTSATTARIRFSFAATSGWQVQVNSSSFRRVADALESGRLTLSTDMSVLPAGAAALYNSATNTLSTRALRGRVERGLFLHEAVHASMDLSLGGRGITTIDNEAAAYTTDALYFRMMGLARSRWSASLHAAAGTVADGLLRQHEVDTAALNALRTAITNHPLYNPYKLIPYLANG